MIQLPPFTMEVLPGLDYEACFSDHLFGTFSVPVYFCLEGGIPIIRQGHVDHGSVGLPASEDLQLSVSQDRSGIPIWFRSEGIGVDWASKPERSLDPWRPVVCVNPDEVCEGDFVVPVRYRRAEDDSFFSDIWIPPFAWRDAYLRPGGHVFDDRGRRRWWWCVVS